MEINMVSNIKKLILILFILISVRETLPQNLISENTELRVRIINTLDKLEITFNGEWILSDGFISEPFSEENGLVIFTIDENIFKFLNGEKHFFSDADKLILKCKNDTGTVSIKNVPYGDGWWWEGKEDRTYEGEIAIYKGAGKNLEVVVILLLEEYLKGVVPYEMGGDSPLEALRAQAVAARSEAVIALTSKLYNGDFHDITSDVECQVFSGNRKRTLESDKAVDDTEGFILSEDGKPINAYYASNCGGHSELIKNVWPERPDPDSYQVALQDSKDRPELDLSGEDAARDWIFSKPEVYCNPYLRTKLPSWSQKNFRWTKEFSVDSISKMIAGDNDYGNLINIKVLKRGISGRMYLARFIFEKDSVDVKGELAIRQLWHPSLRSACFVVDEIGDKFILNGAGWGHGVGMCQSGAVAQAKQGADFRSILKHYYQKAELIYIY